MAGEGGGASVYFNMVEREQTAAMQRELTPGDVFFDIGANVGYYSILASRLVGETGIVVACEPLARNISNLERHVTLNRATNVKVLAFACSNENSITSFSLGHNTATGHIGANGNASSILVPTITLDTLAKKMNVRPNVIKIDVEGAEMAVLEGAQDILANDRPRIFLSTHSEQLRTDCITHLSHLGYEAVPLVPEDDCHEFLARPTR
jgi:FkbM family methyltransferase